MRGFSLVEILIIISIIAILAGISVSIWRPATCSTNLKTSAEEIIAKLQVAQQNTITEQTAYLVRFNDAENKYQLIRAPALENEEIIETLYLKQDIEFQAIDIEDLSSEIKFTSIGAPIASGTITLGSMQCTDKTSQIKITPAGYIYRE